MSAEGEDSSKGDENKATNIIDFSVHLKEKKRVNKEEARSKEIWKEIRRICGIDEE